jgi:hypothetical protein
MDCASFEILLQQVISGEIEARERGKVLSDLERHAEACPDCEGVGDLLEWLALPGGEVDIVDGPGEAYWAGFNDRLRERIASDAPPVASKRTGWRRWAGAAAVLATAALALWIAFGPIDDGSATQRAGAESSSKLPRTTRELPASLVEIIENDPAALQDVGFGAGGGWPGAYDDGGWVFPDTEDLDPAAREELLEWLRERTPERAGVRS